MEKQKEIFLVTGFNEAFLSRATEYLDTIQKYSNVRNIVVTLDFRVSDVIRQKYTKIDFRYIDSPHIKSPNPNFCMQHGGFLKALEDLGNDDIIIFTDADILLQRSFSEDEIRFYRLLMNGEVAVGYNQSDRDYLISEAVRLKPTVEMDRICSLFSDIDRLLTYNTGVLAADRSTYQQLYEMYNDQWPTFSSLFLSYAKQQWLLSYLIGKYMKVKLLPAVIHTHGKYPLDERIDGDYGYKFLINTEIVLFNHAIVHPKEILIKKQNKRIKKFQRKIRRLYLLVIVLILLSLFLFLIVIM